MSEIMRSNFVTIQLPPSVNELYTNVYGRGRVKTTLYRNWQKQVVPYLTLALHKFGKQEVQIQYHFELGTSFKGDLSNRIKAIEDALVQAQIIDDDNHKVVGQFSVIKSYSQLKASTVTIGIWLK